MKYLFCIGLLFVLSCSGLSAQFLGGAGDGYAMTSLRQGNVALDSAQDHSLQIQLKDARLKLVSLMPLNEVNLCLFDMDGRLLRQEKSSRAATSWQMELPEQRTSKLMLLLIRSDKTSSTYRFVW